MTKNRELRELARLAFELQKRCERVSPSAAPQERLIAKRETQALDAHIDRLVYALFGLAQDEVSIVEGGIAQA